MRSRDVDVFGRDSSFGVNGRAKCKHLATNCALFVEGYIVSVAWDSKDALDTKTVGGEELYALRNGLGHG